MNELGWIILGAAVRATALAAFGLLAVVALKRRGPSAGALAGSATMLVMVGVTALAVSPWPRWWSPELVEPAAPKVIAPSVKTEDSQLAQPVVEPALLPKVEPAGAATWSDFVREFRRELAKPTATGLRSSWRWPAWLACLFLGGLAFALFRLGLGLWAVRSLRSRSRVIHDPTLIQTFTMLRGELGLERPIELRESTELATPAMVGWRTPAVILPEGWSEWDEAERRAVLAHELAHIYRGDYLTGLFAQLSLSLHFYHPLAHALSRRLRLQQELAADALGAALAGGRRPYLTALANLALRQNPRPAAWPARPFLPTRGTFLRRIEMLRDPKALQHPPMRRVFRFVTVATLAVVGLLIAGFRGPSGSTLAEDPRITIVYNPLTYQVPPLDTTTASSDVRYAIDLRPKVLLENAELKKLAGMVPANGVKVIALLLSGEIDQVVLLGTDRQAAIDSPAFSFSRPTIVLRASKPIDWKATITPKVEEVRSEGISYFRAGTGASSICYRVLDDRTFLIGTEADVKLPPIGGDRPKGRHSWDDAWKKLPTGPFRVAFDTPWLARRLPPMGRPGAPLQVSSIFAPLLDKAQAYGLSIGVGDGLTVDALATCGTEEAAGRVADTVKACLALGRNALPDIRRSVEGAPPEMARPAGEVLDAIDTMIETAKVEQNQSVATLRAKADAASVTTAVKLLFPAIAASREAAKRAQCINNLKQIMLAMHNYHFANKCFPPAVLYGPDGKTPYSWRVALLPYLEQNELYEEYKFDEPWDGPNNIKLVEKMPAVFACPDDEQALKAHFSSYFVPVGPDTLFPDRKEGMRIADIPDGTSLMIAVIEAKRPIPWTKPEDIKLVNGLPEKPIGQLHPSGFDVGFADGSVRFLKETINEFVLKALFTRAGGEVISRDAL